MREYENILKTSENREPPRAYYIPYATLESALEGKREASPYYKLLNGIWSFKYFSRDIDMPQTIDEWDSIPVPSCWQAHGYGNIMYTNLNYPYPVDPPYVPDENPLGVYRCEFEITKEWAERETYIVFEGVASCMYLYMNGTRVGFSQGSHLGCEFNITEYIREGKNILTVKVLKFCVGSYLEDQDFFRFSGIFRDVYLLSRETGHIKDVFIKADTKAITADAESYEIYEGNVRLDEITEPILWNAEKPHLYTVIVKGRTEFIPFKVGMREVKISPENELLINGVPVKLKGVNRHDTHPTNGYVMTDEELRLDLCKMKELNINCIRMSHYPPTPYLLSLCDEMGFYVIDETDIETHGFSTRLAEPSKDEVYDVGKGEWLCEMTDWGNEFLERMQRMVYRDKNFTSIIMWSTGNESGHGKNIKKMIDFTRKYDPSRLIHCEDLSHMSAEHGFAARMYTEMYSDVYSRMYISIPECMEFCLTKPLNQPLFLCEFAHASGIGPGDIADYTECMYSFKRFIGGCIWEWADHVFMKNGVPCYGGDFGERIHDKQGCIDGIVFADRSFSSGSYEVKAAYQPFAAYISESGKIVLENRYDFTNLSERKVVLELSVDGVTVDKRETSVTAFPHERAELDMPFTLPETCKLGVFLTVSILYGEGEVGFVQLEMPVPVSKIQTSLPHKRLEDKGNIVTVSGRGYEYTFDKFSGVLTSIVKGGVEQLAAPMTLGAYRAPTDNERNEKAHWYCYDDNQLSENLNIPCGKVYGVTVNENKITVSASLSGISRAPFFRYTAEYEFFEDGEIKVSISGALRDSLSSYLPRLGFDITLRERDAEFEYFAYGERESYCDMHRHAKMGLYRSRASSEYVPYPYPEEHGNHYGARMLSFKNGIEFLCDGQFEFNVSEYTGEALEAAMHLDELVKNGYTNLRVDYKVSGIGSASVGPKPLTQYQLCEKEIAFTFVMK